MPDVAGGITEDKVQSKAFELVFAFDEVITTGGHKESITLQQVSVECSSLSRHSIAVFISLLSLLVFQDPFQAIT